MVNRLKKTQPVVDDGALAELEQKKAHLRERLEKGDAYITKLATDDPKREGLITAWIEILHDYEAVCREIWEKGTPS